MTLVVLVFLLFATPSFSQQIDPYQRILDPLSIADLSGPDSLISSHISFVHGGFQLEDDGFRVFADLHGPGIVSHFWATHPDIVFDTAGKIKLYIDDTLVLSSPIIELFLGNHGRLRAPLDTTQSGGLVCDVQIPFKRRFKLTYKGTFNFFQLSWRPVPHVDLINSFDLFDTLGLSSQIQAEQNFRASSIPGNTQNVLRVEHSIQIASGQTFSVVDRNGHGVVRELQIIPTLFDPKQYQSIYLRCYWDQNDHPSVDVPLADFFGLTSGMKSINAIQLKTGNTVGMQSLFSMPFSHHARIEIVNKSDIDANVSVIISIDTTDREWNRYGRFHAQFNEVSHPRVFHFIPVASAKGRGRIIGVMFNLMKESNPPFFLEGDPFIVIDSSSNHTLTYPGSEDYFNGGYYYRDGAFTLPFAGCPKEWNTMYRFHYFDALNFSRSVDWRWQHGKSNDFDEHYRTVSYMYLAPIPFWTLIDTITAQSTVEIRGSGYLPDEPISITMGSVTHNTFADNAGKFAASIPGSQVGLGSHEWTVNSILSPRTVSILSSPVMEYTVDSTYPLFTVLDSIHIQLRGFTPHTTVAIRLGDKEIGNSIPISQRGTGHATLRLGLVDSGSHQLIAVYGDQEVVAARPVEVSRRLRYEIENLLPPTHTDIPFEKTYMGWWTNSQWSNSYAVFMHTSGQGERITLPFTVPMADSFLCELVITKGKRYARIDVEIDDRYIATLEGYENGDFSTPSQSLPLSLGIIPLSIGSHTLTLRVSSRHPDAVEWAMNPDVLFLTPHSSESSVVPKTKSSSWLTILSRLEGLFLAQVNHGAQPEFITLELLDLFGRSISRFYEGILTSNDLIIPIPTNHLAAGAYFVRLQSTSGQVETRLIIKK